MPELMLTRMDQISPSSTHASMIFTWFILGQVSIDVVFQHREQAYRSLSYYKLSPQFSMTKSTKSKTIMGTRTAGVVECVQAYTVVQQQ